MAYKNVKMTKHIKYIESMMEDPISDEVGYNVYGEMNGTLGELVATTYRIIFGSKSLFSGETFEDVYYDDIDYVSYAENYKGATIEIYVKNSGRVLEVYSTSKTGLKAMRDLIIKITNQLKEEKEKTSITKEPAGTIDELQKLIKMKVNGHLSEEEFRAFKAKLLN